MNRTKLNSLKLSAVGGLACFGLLALTSIISGSSLPAKASSPAPCPNPAPVTISPSLSSDVCIPDGFAGNPIAFFDDYSWRSFIAMAWPAQAGNRGVADASRNISDPGPRVFETFKADWEVFQPLGARPANWDQYSGTNPCSLASVGFEDLVLASFSKFGNLGQAGFGDLVGPLVAQNNTYTRYLTGFNRTEFDQILNNELFLKKNIDNVVFQNGAVDVKSAWIDMTNVSHPERYYIHKNAWVFNLEQNRCEQKDVGLVGLHIVQKTLSRPQWIWSSFEQVDHIPQGDAVPPFAYHDGTGQPMPASNPIPFPPPDTPPTKFNVQRLKPIDSSTQATNLNYQAALRNAGGAPWQFYQLVMTQWPLQKTPGQPIPATQTGRPANTFPGTGATTAFSNLTMETFDQKEISTGCMNCHNLTRVDTDFLWVLSLHAFDANSPITPPSLPPVKAAPSNTPFANSPPTPNARRTLKLTPGLQQLKSLMQTAISKPKSLPTNRRRFIPRATPRRSN